MASTFFGSSAMAKRLHNQLYFQRRRILVSGAFCGAYAYTCYDALSWKNEVLRMGVAGSLANIAVETSFHFIDTVNIRSKATTTGAEPGFKSLVNKIWQKEGLYGFGKGFSACFYGAAACGFVYFALYKFLKGIFKERFGGTVDMALCYMLASFVAETLTLSVQYPYDLIKCRLQSVNYIFKYQNLPHAFRKEARKNGVRSLYNGAGAFLVTYCTFVALQFTIYEKTMSYFKATLEPATFAARELPINCLAGFLGGVVGAALTNSFEAVTVAKQTSPNLNIWNLIKTERLSLLTKGVWARVYYNGA